MSNAEGDHGWVMNFCPNCGQRVDLVRPFQCLACEVWQWSNPKPCAGVLIEHKGKVLLLHRAFEPWKDHWDIPGGFCDGGEHPNDAAVREVKEELGLDITLTGLIGMWMDTYGESANAESILNVYYLVRWEGDEPPSIILDLNEASRAQWFGPDELPNTIGFPGHMPAAIAAWASVASGQRELGVLP